MPQKLKDDSGVYYPPKIAFKNVKNLISVPFVIYADIEAIQVRKDDSTEKSEMGSWTEVKTEHIASAVAYKVVCHDNCEYSKPVRVFNGENCIEKFLDALLSEEKEILEYMDMFKVSQHNLSPKQRANMIVQTFVICVAAANLLKIIIK